MLQLVHSVNKTTQLLILLVSVKNLLLREPLVSVDLETLPLILEPLVAIQAHLVLRQVSLLLISPLVPQLPLPTPTHSDLVTLLPLLPVLLDKQIHRLVVFSVLLNLLLPLPLSLVTLQVQLVQLVDLAALVRILQAQQVLLVVSVALVLTILAQLTLLLVGSVKSLPQALLVSVDLVEIHLVNKIKLAAPSTCLLLVV